MPRPTSDHRPSLARSAPLARVARSAALAIALAGATACGSGGGGGEAAPGMTLQSVTVSPVSPSIAKGLAQAFTATGHYSDGSTQDLTAVARWTSASTGVATTSEAVANGVGEGSSTISAAYGGKSGEATLTVTAPVLAAVVVAPETADVAAGLTQAFTATGRYSDGSTEDLTASATWTSSPTSVATISADGIATTAARGQALVTATFGDRSGEAVLTVGAPVLQSVVVGPPTASIAAGLTEAFTATGHDSDGSTRDVTLLASWTSSSPSVASVATGVATGRIPGSATIEATLDGFAGQASLVVGAPLLVSVEVLPGAASVAKGLTQAFTATGHYSDGSTQGLTASATWTSSTGAAAMSGAVATGAAEGTSTIAAAYGGKSGEATLTVGPAALQSITVSPASASMAKGLTQAFTATGHSSDGSTQDLTAVATWTSASTGVATMSGAVATGVAEGSSTIAAAYAGKSGEATLTVGPAALQSITVSPASASVAKGLTQAFTATGRSSDGSTQDLTAVATWTSERTDVATLSGAVATGAAQGASTITAAYGGKSGEATLTVGPAVVESVTLSPASATIAKGLTEAFTATAHWSDARTSDVTATATWTMDDPPVATASGNVVTAHLVGSTHVHATVQGVTASADVTVTAAVVTAVTVSPVNAALAVGTTRQLQATAVYSDGGKQDVTGSASWASEDGTVASVTTGGVAGGVSPGTVTLSATSSSISGSTRLTVTSARLTSISISPSASTIPLDVTQAFTATGLFDDGTMQDLTTQVAWASTYPGYATISTVGVVTPVAAGTTDVEASLGAVSSSTTLTVSNGTLQSLSIEPAGASIADGTSTRLSVTGTYSDGSSQELTAFATWSAIPAAVATVSSAAGTEGLVTGVEPGSATVTATFGGQSSSCAVTVTSAALLSISVTPSGADVPAGLVQSLTATGTFSDGSTQDLTAAAAWTSSDTAIAQVSNAAGSEGDVMAVTQGSVTLTASYGGVTGTAPLTVTSATLVSIAVTPANAMLPAGYTLRYTATATYSDSSTRTVTSQVTWASSNTATATISNAAGAQGLATGVAASTTPVQVTATLSGLGGSTPLTVTSSRLSSVAVTPSPFSVASRSAIQLTATGTFTGPALTLDITRQCGWSTSSRATATVSRTGAVTGVAAGAVTITAKKTGKSGPAGGTVY